MWQNVRRLWEESLCFRVCTTAFIVGLLVLLFRAA